MAKAKLKNKLSREKNNTQGRKIILSRTLVKTNSYERKKNKLGHLVETLIQFLREVKIEFRKVVWPSRRQTVVSTGIVLLLVVLVSFFLGIIDVILARFIHMLLVN